ncbi:methyl-accepting chemotaxis protein [Herbaspirillum huttiense]|uniref:methyl-accepting chemotaxis protein n=1 Tax=Herbaspirillum huttiense TaxID=863372 RepID=UPI0031D88731
MKWFADLKISRKLISVFGLIVVLVLGQGLFALAQLERVNQAAEDIATNWLPSIREASAIETHLARMRSFNLQYVIASDDNARKAAEDGAATQLKLLRGAMERYAAMLSEPEEKELYPQIARNIDIIASEQAKLIQLTASGRKDEATAVFWGAFTTSYLDALKNLDVLISVNNKGSEKSHGVAVQTYEFSLYSISAMLLTCAVLSMLLAIWISRLVSRPLVAAVEVARQVAAGDLTATIVVQSKDETGELMASLKTMNTNLHSIVSQVRTSVDTISTASSEIAAGNFDLSNRTEQQASALEETASSMEELTSTVKQNADNARQANQLAVAAVNVAGEGGQVVNEVVQTMTGIEQSSRKMSEIIGIIDGIAFQTNILALNAAVEAARAGEQGRGFAVVASEVRTLAQRSASAAKDIKNLIDDSMGQVSEGSLLVERAGATISEVVSSVQRVTDVVAEISNAGQEQSAGIDQIGQAIGHIDEVTQQNAALVEQAAAAAKSLEEQAGQLSELVSAFRLAK